MITFLCLVLLAYILFSQKGIEAIKHMRRQVDKITVVIDAGHGGFDPGKIGINNALEKEINLSIAYKLKSLLEQNDIQVIMTRKDDNGLYEEKSRYKKSVDMRKRVEIINSSDAIIAISIHQNSFTQESSRGAQVFYYQKSSEGKILAEILQEGIKRSLKDGNHRLAKSNGSYYMLKQTKCPLVIVECGFLSNWKEAKLLNNEAYQDKMAWAIHLGILEYINSK
ncbi:MAG: putative rane protein [Herbinix sp.]|jgi:N-acetylmuramoyl-L-alanine amidase|nr:putative rane protein [Herbinix sp.]